jgi:hypothetical protein
MSITMADERNNGTHEARTDYETRFAAILQQLEQTIQAIRIQRGAGEGGEDVGAFANYSAPEGGLSFTVRSSRAGHLVVESVGRSVVIDVSSSDVVLEITANDRVSQIEADAAGIFVLTDVQKKLSKLEIDSVES